MSGILVLITLALNAPLLCTGLAMLASGALANREQKQVIRYIVIFLSAFVAVTSIYFLLLMNSKNLLDQLHNRAEGGYTENLMIGYFALGYPFWGMIGAVLAIYYFLRKSSLNHSISGGILLGISSFNFFIIIYAKKIL